MSSTTPPPIPARLSRLPELAHDLWWTWNTARDVFRRLDYTLWRQTAHNPVQVLQRVTEETLQRAAADPGFLAVYDAALTALDAMRSNTAPNWFQQRLGTPSTNVVAYFCAEFALHQSL